MTGDSLNILLVTGMSGSGMTTALKALEDLGYEAVDNVPLSLVGNLVHPAQKSLPGKAFRRPIAVGVDCRNREFSVDTFLEELDHLSSLGGLSVKVLFLDCDDEVLLRRYVETRHRHPLSGDRPLADGIRAERKLVLPLREKADEIIDSTELSVTDFNRLMRNRYALNEEPEMVLTVMSFGFKNGVPREADMVFDARFLRNPHYENALRTLTGKDIAVQDFVSQDDGFTLFMDRLMDLLDPLLPRYRAEGKSYLTVAIGCTGGRHRSVFSAETLANRLQQKGHVTQIHHRDLAKP